MRDATRPGRMLALALEFWRYAIGRDYFRQPQPIGMHFADPRCYYNDLRGKTLWSGPFLDGVPALRESGGNLYVSPCMVMLFGLGTVDRLLLERDQQLLAAVRAVVRWLQGNVNAEGYWPEHIANRIRHEFYSTNSAMNQGLALSLLLRVIRWVEDAALAKGDLQALLRRASASKLTPAIEGGTASRRGPELYFLEYCRRDEVVVFNGWVYAVFGLMDYVAFSSDESARSALQDTLHTMREKVRDYQLPSGWARYDDNGRIASPFYHRLHISLLDALFRLTGHTEYAECLGRARAAHTIANRTKFSIRKIGDKLTDS